jgi:hypothetical protein
VVGLPGFEPGTSASQTGPERKVSALVASQKSLEHQVEELFFESLFDRSVPFGTPVVREIAPRSRQSAPNCQTSSSKSAGPICQFRQPLLR